MPRSSRRRFMSNTGKTTSGFIHHVYFWLKNADSQEDKAKLIEGLRKLSAAPSIQHSYIGQPADTHRDVVDRTYSVSWLLFFRNKEDEEVYQTDPVHLHFIETCSALWSKVIVYDSVEV